MAEKVEHEIGPNYTHYPWHKWADGGTWLLIRGEDYHVSTKTMQTGVHVRAAALGMKVQTQAYKSSPDKEGLYVKFMKREIRPRPKRRTEKLS